MHGEDDLVGIDIESRGTAVGTGGMITKIEAARIATSAGIPTVLTSADQAAAALAGEVGRHRSSTPPGGAGRPGCSGSSTPATPAAS